MADFAALIASLHGLGPRLVDASARALKTHGDNTLERANAPGMVPVDSGATRDSGYVEGPLVGSGRASIRIGYATPYSLKLHEAPQSERKTGQTKWLEVSIVAHADDYGRLIKAELGL